MKYVIQNKQNKWFQINGDAYQYNSCQALDRYMLAISRSVPFTSLVILHNFLKSVNLGVSDGWIAIQVGHFAVVNIHSHLR